MASSFDDWTLDGIRNPLRLQGLILDRFEEGTGGKYTIVDPNNVTSFLIESFSSIVSGAINKIDEFFLPAAYPSRAVSMTDLYKHLSDYDYLGLFASPSPCSIILIVDRSYLMNNAIDVTDANGTTLYKKVVIPQTTRFTIGSYTFGLYYPIEIRVSSQTGMFTVLYDMHEKNPLHVLSQNILEYNFRKNDGMDLAYIKIPIYQFNTTTYSETLVGGTGFRKILDFTDQFYALKVTGEVRDPATDTWSTKEFSLALQGRKYNPEDPTVIFTVDPLNHQVVLDIPYVYFTENRVRGNLRIDLYTTHGYMNYQIPATTEEMVGIDMFGVPLDTETQRYAEPFRTMPALGAVPVTMKIVGGTDGMSYTDLRRKILNDAFGDKTLQTPADVDSYFQNQGYVTSLFQDGITDRIFNAHSVLRTSDDAIVAAASVGTLFTQENLTSSNKKTIVDCGNSTFTILPSTRYLFDQNKGICVPLTDLELDTLDGLNAADRVKYFNEHTITLSPYHLQVSLKDKYPSSRTFDMSDAGIISREYLTSRAVNQHLSLNSASMTVIPVTQADDDARITDKYQFEFKVIRSGLDGFEAESIVSGGTHKNLRVFVGLKNLNGNYVFAEATYTGRASDMDYYSLTVSSTAVFSQTDGGYATRIKDPFSKTGVDVYLSTEIRVILCVNGEIESLKSFYQTDEHPNRWLETDFTGADFDDVDDYIALSEHRINLKFGSLVNELDQRISLAYSGEQYLKYNTTEFSCLEGAIYETQNGSPVVQWIDDQGRVVEHPDYTQHTAILKTLYPAGTMKGYTQQTEESLVISRYLANNYEGCEWFDEDIQRFSDIKLIGTTDNEPWDLVEGRNLRLAIRETLAKLEGKTTTLKARVVPRFSITAAKLHNGNESPILGLWELANANQVSPTPSRLSMSTDKWYKASARQDGVARIVTTYRIQTVDALRYIFDNILKKNGQKDPLHVVLGYDVSQGYTEEDGAIIPVKYLDDPFAQIKNVEDGLIVLVEYDQTEAEPIADCHFEDEDKGHKSRLYIRSNGAWVCLAVCSDYEGLKAYLACDYTKTKKEKAPIEGKVYYRQTETGFAVVPEPQKSDPDYEMKYAEYVRNFPTYYVLRPKAYGYAYVLDCCEQATVTGTTWQNGSVPTGAPKYIAFVTNINGLPNFTALDTITEDDEGKVITTAADPAWATHANHWPWEIKRWCKITTDDDDRSPTYTRETFVEDDLFATAFDAGRLTKYCLHTSGQIKLDSNTGNPIPDPDHTREVQYLVNMLQVDAKLTETTAVKSNHTYPSELVETMRTHFENLGAVKNRLYTSTKLFFEPMKSLGLANFYTDGERIKEHALDITMGFRLHVSSDIADDDEMMESMKNSIIKLIDDHMATGNTSMTTLAQAIKDANSDSVRYVDVLGIDGDPDLQTMRCVDAEVRPHLKHELKLLDDGVTIDLTRGLNLEFVVADV